MLGASRTSEHGASEELQGTGEAARLLDDDLAAARVRQGQLEAAVKVGRSDAPALFFFRAPASGVTSLHATAPTCDCVLYFFGHFLYQAV